MIIRKYHRETDTLFLYSEIERLGLFADHIIGSDIEFSSFFERQLRYYYSDFWIIEDQQSKQQKGFVYIYDYRIKDGHCIFDFHINSSNREQKRQLIQQVINSLFREYPLNCIFIYVDTCDFDKAELCTGFGAKQEALLKEYHFKNGSYVDVKVMSLRRELHTGVLL